jgi:hypothetical protein
MGIAEHYSIDAAPNKSKKPARIKARGFFFKRIQAGLLQAGGN